MEEIIAALISATGSVIVALIGKSRDAQRRRSAKPTYDIPPRNRRIWFLIVTLLSMWSLYAPLALGWPVAAIDLLVVVPLVMVAASALFPPKPFWTAAAVLMLYAVHFLLLAMYQASESISARNLQDEVIVLLGAAFLVAIVSWAVARTRTRRYLRLSGSRTETVGETERVTSAALLADEITKLDALRKSGALSEEEFQAAKRRLIGM